jgi:glucan phosphoethanolaminetransferase (alkaline phosphatase superfamily)
MPAAEGSGEIGCAATTAPPVALPAGLAVPFNAAAHRTSWRTAMLAAGAISGTPFLTVYFFFFFFFFFLFYFCLAVNLQWRRRWLEQIWARVAHRAE